jgi:hypothetical protein
MGWIFLTVWLLTIPLFFNYFRSELSSTPWTRFLELVLSLVWPVVFILALVWVIFYSEESEDEIIPGDRERIE